MCRILPALVVLTAFFCFQQEASAKVCYAQSGMTHDCSGGTGGSSADFTGQCHQVPVYVEVPCQEIYEEITLTRHQAMEWCNLNSYDPDNWRYWGSACNYDNDTAYQTCRVGGYDGVKSMKKGSWNGPSNNGITRWEPARQGFASYNAKSAGNSLIDKLVCYRTRYE